MPDGREGRDGGEAERVDRCDEDEPEVTKKLDRYSIKK